MGVKVSNLGVSDYTVVLSFTGGRDRIETEDFIIRTLKEINSNWPVKLLDSDVVQYNSNCI